MRLILLALLLAGSVAAQTPVQGVFPITLGIHSANWNPGSTVHNVDAAGDNACFGFVLSNDKTLSKVKIRLNSVVGSPAAADTELDLRNDSSGFPSGSSIEEKDVSASPTGGAWNEWTGYTSALTAGTRYWLCLNNANGTPASNYFTVRVTDNSSAGTMVNPWSMSAQTRWGWQFCQSADSGATCATNQVPRFGIRLEFSDGTFAGSALDPQTGVESTNKTYAARELGVQFTTPADGPTLNIKCISFNNQLTGTAPAGGARYRLYTGTGASRTLQATTTTLPNTNLVSGWAPLCFTTAYSVAPGTTVSIMQGVVSGGDASNYLALEKANVDNTAGSKALQFLGGLKATYLNSTFADDDTAIYPFMVMLDTNDPFNVSGTSTDVASSFNKPFN